VVTGSKLDCIFRRVYADSAGGISLHYTYREQMRKKVSRKQITTLSSAERVGGAAG